jgi:hypothetical protein
MPGQMSSTSSTGSAARARCAGGIIAVAWLQQHAVLVDIAGVAGIPAGGLGADGEVVIVVGDRDDPRPRASSLATTPSVDQRLGGQVDQLLDGVGARGRIGQIAKREIAR